MEVTINLSKIRTKNGVHKAIKKALNFPRFYGKNFDALFDLLTSGHENWKITFLGCKNAEIRFGEWFKTLQSVFEEAQQGGANILVLWEN